MSTPPWFTPRPSLDRAVARMQAPVVALRARRRHFSLAGVSYAYFVHPYNATWRNERTVEMPVALRLLEERAEGRILEIGNVSAWYGGDVPPREIVDKYEAGPGVRNLDVVEIEPGPRFDLVLAISTLEHVGFDEDVKDPAKVGQAVRHLRSLLAPGGIFMATIPIGYNPAADALVLDEEPAFDEVHVVRRMGKESDWAEVRAEEVRGLAYGTPYPMANAVAFGFSRA